jgi:hypothetical protein
MLIVHIGPAEQGHALAVFGPNVPAPSATLRALPEHPGPPELLARLAGSFDTAAGSLLAELAQIELYEASSDSPIDLAARRPEPSCVSLRRPAPPPAAVAVAVVRCGEAPQLSALLLVEADALVPFGAHADWSLVAEAELLAAVDLDGDGIDELLIANSSIEWYELQTLRWDGAAYQRVPELPPITPPEPAVKPGGASSRVAEVYSLTS